MKTTTRRSPLTLLLSLALLLVLVAAFSGCAKRQLTRSEMDAYDSLAARIAAAEAAGAREKAPAELARAKVALAHARHEAEEGDEGEKALSEARAAVEALEARMKPAAPPPSAAPSGKAPAAEGPSAGKPVAAPPAAAGKEAAAPGAEEGAAADRSSGTPPGTAPGAGEARPGEPPQVVDGALLEDIHFDFDRSFIREDAKPALGKVADWLRKNPSRKLLIEGHCDERGTVEYNMALGERRAESARKYLVSLGVSADRLGTISYGKERPLKPGHDEESWAANRRCHFVPR